MSAQVSFSKVRKMDVIKRSVVLTAVSVMCAIGNLHAAGVSCLTQGHFWVTGEALCWKAYTEDTPFATFSSSSPPLAANIEGPIGMPVAVEPRYQWGYRIEAGYLNPCCQWDLRAAWTYFRAVDSASVVIGPGQRVYILVTPPYLSPVFYRDVGRAKEHRRVMYEAVDVDIGWRNCSFGCLRTRLGGGVKFLRFCQNVDADYSGRFFHFNDPAEPDADAEINQVHSRTYGIGPGAGIDLTLPVRCGFSLVADAYGYLIVSRLDSNFMSRSTEQTEFFSFPLSVHNSPIWRFLPLIEFKAGVRYDRALTCRLQAHLEVGYDYLKYWNAIQRTTYTSRNGYVLYRSADLSGFYIQLGIAF